MASGPFTDDERRQLRKLHGEGQSLYAIAKAMGRARSTISDHAGRLGLSFDRGPTETATAAVVVDAKARRAALALGLLDDAQRLRTRLWDPFELHSFGGSDHSHRKVTLQLPPPKDQRDLMGAVTQAVQSSLRLDEHDADSGSGEAVGMIGALFDQLRRTRPSDEPDDPEEVTEP